jgi:hypothetical protein
VNPESRYTANDSDGKVIRASSAFSFRVHDHADGGRWITMPRGRREQSTSKARA